MKKNLHIVVHRTSFSHYKLTVLPLCIFLFDSNNLKVDWQLSWGILLLCIFLCIFLFDSINLKVERGELIAVVGVVGAGKSSLLSAILGEMEKLDGQVTVQVSWILSGCAALFGHFCL